MGMFDYINFKIKCPNCKSNLNNFQSKDGSCVLNHLEFWEVDNFYDSCPICNTRIEYNIRKRFNRKLNIKDYYKKVEIPSKKEQEKYKKQQKDIKKMLGIYKKV